MAPRTQIALSILIVAVFLGGYFWYIGGTNTVQNSPSLDFVDMMPGKKEARADLPQEVEIVLAGRTIRAAHADTLEEQERGLIGVAAIADDQGMLYTFDVPTSASFWNKGMMMSYDLLWIKDDIVVGIESHVPKGGDVEEDYLVLDSPGEITAALELSAGWHERYGLKPGDPIRTNVE